MLHNCLVFKRMFFSHLINLYSAYAFLLCITWGDGNHLDKLYGFDPQSMYGQTAEKGKYNATLKTSYDAVKTTLEDRFKIRKGKKNTRHGMFVRNDGFTGCGGNSIWSIGIWRYLSYQPIHAQYAGSNTFIDIRHFDYACNFC